MSILILVIGLPGSGKDLISRHIAYIIENSGLKVSRCCVGEKLRSLNAIQPTGDLSDISIIAKILQEFFIIKSDVYILDGFPRSVEQLQYLKQICFDKIATMILECSTETAISRLCNRFMCKQCTKSLSKDFCDDCGVWGEQRCDDLNVAVVAKRVTIYQESIESIIDLVKASTQVLYINAELSICEIKREVEKLTQALISA